MLNIWGRMEGFEVKGVDHVEFAPCMGVVFNQKYYVIHCYDEWSPDFFLGQGVIGA